MEKCKRCGQTMLTFDKRVIYCPKCKKTPVGDKVTYVDCSICGDKIMNIGRIKKTSHRECLVDYYYDKFYHNEKLGTNEYAKAYANNIDLNEIREIVRQDKEGKI